MQHAGRLRSEKARRAAEAAEAKEATRREERAEDQRRSDERFAESEAGRNNRNAIMAQAQAGKAAAAREEARRIREEAQARKAAEDIQKQKEKYRAALKADGITDVQPAIDELKSAIVESKRTHDGDIAGAGGSGFLVDMAGGGAIAESHLSPEGRRVRNAQRMLKEAFGRGQSGAAIGEAEQEAFGILIGDRLAGSDQQLEEALQVFQRWVQQRELNAATTFPSGAEAFKADREEVQRARGVAAPDDDGAHILQGMGLDPKRFKIREVR
jgi:hypothetical protein